MYEDFIEHQPMTEEEALGLLPNGDYQASVDEVSIRQSKDGKKYFVHKYIIQSTPTTLTYLTKMLYFPYLLKHFYEVTGMEDKYNENKLYTRDQVGKRVTLKIYTTKAKDGYPPKNDVSDILKANEKEVKFEDDELPF